VCTRWDRADLRLHEMAIAMDKGSARGFSLLEVLVATTIAIVAIAGLAQFAAIGATANRRARLATLAAVLAQQKMEQLRALTWAFDVDGQPVTDQTSDVSISPEQAGGTGLGPSAADSLERNTSGACDFLDGRGRWIGAGATPPAQTVYVRRWNVAPLVSSPDRTLVVQVAVFAYPGVSPLVRLVALRTRTVP